MCYDARVEGRGQLVGVVSLLLKPCRPRGNQIQAFGFGDKRHLVGSTEV